MKRSTHIIVSCFFIGFIFLPFLLFLFTPDKKVSLFEKRSLAQKPDLAMNLQALSRYPDALENYFKDQLGMRDRLVALYNLFYVQVFHESPESSVIVGRDGWLFYNPGRRFLDNFGLAERKPQVLEIWLRRLEDRLEWMSDRGIHYLMVIVPDKLMIYPEKLPRRLQGRIGESLLDQVLDFMKGRTVMGNVLDLRSELIIGSKKRQVYRKAGTHWNSDGAFIGYTAIMRRLQKWIPEIVPIEKSALKREPLPISGDLSYVLHLREVFKEKSSTLRVVSPCAKSQNSRLVDFVHPLKKYRGNPLFYPVENGCRQKPFTAIIIHDSFGLAFRSYFSESFGRVIFSHFASLNNLKSLIEKVKPDVIIDERVARNLYGLFRYDPGIEQEILKKHFDGSDDIVLRIDTSSKPKEFVNGHDLIMKQGPEGLQLHATGNDPFAELHFKSPADTDSLIVRISITSPGKTDLQFFYTTSTEKEFSPGRMISRKIKKGENTIFLRLPHPDAFGKVRFDPGTIPGDYTLHSLVIKREYGG